MNALSRLGTTIASTVVLFACALAFASDVVVMRSGTYYEGTITKYDGAEVELTIEGGKIQLQRTQIASIHFETTTDQVKALLNPPAPAPPASPTSPTSPTSPADPMQPTTPPPVPPTTPVPIYVYPPGYTAPPGWAPPAADELPVGAWYRTPQAEIRIKSVSVERAVFRDIFRIRQRSDTDFLIVTFEINNPTTNRKFRCREGEESGSYFAVYDDTGAKARPVSFGVGTRLEGALKVDEEIGAGKLVTHVMAFPRPRFGCPYLTLQVSMAVFNLDGRAKFRINAGDIQQH